MIKNRVKVSICDTTYSLVADNEEQSHVFQSAYKVDSAMRSILQESGNLISSEKAAVLTAIQFSSTILKTEVDSQHMMQKIAFFIEKIDQELLILDSF